MSLPARGATQAQPVVLAWLDRLNNLLVWAVGALLVVVAFGATVQVVVRFILTATGLNISAPWSEELARYALVWMIFIGAGVGCRKAQLIAVEFVVHALPATLGKTLRFATILLCMGFALLLIVVGYQFVQLGMTETSPAMGLNKALVYWAMPIGCGLMLVNSAALMAEAIIEGQDIRLAGADAEYVE